MQEEQVVRGADVLVTSLVEAGVEVLFGLPGDTGVVLYDALHGRRDGIRHVLTRDERHASIMADAYARTTNRVGVLEVSSGGGCTYAVGGLGEAYSSAIPLLLLSSDIHSASRGSGALTEIDQLSLFAAVTKWRVSVERAGDIPGLVAEALSHALTGRPGPVALVLPEDVLDEEVVVGKLPAELTGLAAGDLRPRPTVGAAELDATAELLLAAQRPAIVAGSGVHHSSAWAELGQLAEAAACPVATTIHGKGAIAETSDLSLGVAGNNGGRPYVNEYLATADTVLFVGTRANATDTNSYTTPARGEANIVHLDIDPRRAGANYPGSRRLVGDAAVVLGELGERVRNAGGRTDADVRRRVADDRAAWRAEEERPELPSGQLLPRDVIRAVADVLGDAVTVLADPGTPTPNVASYWECHTAGRTVLVPRGHGPMGWAVPATVGAALGEPRRPVVAFTADGSFAMAGLELETIARLALPVCFVQFTNDSLGWIKMLQHLYSGQRYFSVDPGPIDAPAVADACGVEGRRVTTATELEDALERFAQARAPIYLDVQVPHMIDHLPPVPFWRQAIERGGGRPVY
ncbi:MAG: thiamine pyrophosphate-binding protein [Streptosporangiales bacterium]|nr:thiamine pyrophosphate-binding protein [Streptosporangiales bacterium]